MIRLVTGPFLVIGFILLFGWVGMHIANLISSAGWGLLLFLFGMFIILISVIFRRY